MVFKGEACSTDSSDVYSYKVVITKKDAKNIFRALTLIDYNFDDADIEIRAIEMYYDKVSFYNSNKEIVAVGSTFAVLNRDGIQFKGMQDTGDWLTVDDMLLSNIDKIRR